MIYRPCGNIYRPVTEMKNISEINTLQVFSFLFFWDIDPIKPNSSKPNPFLLDLGPITMLSMFKNQTLYIQFQQIWYQISLSKWQKLKVKHIIIIPCILVFQQNHDSSGIWSCSKINVFNHIKSHVYTISNMPKWI